MVKHKKFIINIITRSKDVTYIIVKKVNQGFDLTSFDSTVKDGRISFPMIKPLQMSSLSLKDGVLTQEERVPIAKRAKPKMMPQGFMLLSTFDL